jgi:hypothetical protein
MPMSGGGRRFLQVKRPFRRSDEEPTSYFYGRVEIKITLFYLDAQGFGDIGAGHELMPIYSVDQALTYSNDSSRWILGLKQGSRS